jgi:hypothetical protein
LESLRAEEVSIREYEHHAEQARVEARARYGALVKQKHEKPAFSLRATVLREDPPDYRKSFDDAGEHEKAHIHNI